ncbi:MAG: hypothetical protein MI674_07810 [Cytophagales bacterium]|nr:hypothetical protein [Cytophagales bacterium]
MPKFKRFAIKDNFQGRPEVGLTMKQPFIPNTRYVLYTHSSTRELLLPPFVVIAMTGKIPF